MSNEWKAPSIDEILERINKVHPRLLISQNTLANLRSNIRTNGLTKNWHEHLRSDARKLLSQEPLHYEIPDGLRLLATSRGVLRRVYTLALIYNLDGDGRYAQRACVELESVAGFPDWNPRHFLDTAEMTHAFAIGYDWLYGFLNEGQRAKLRDSMEDKGLNPALNSYRGKESYGWWVRSNHNWNQVCNGGIVMGALAVAEELPQLAGEIIQNALRSIRGAMAQFAPDGAWSEGPGYWNYATFYNVVLLAALQTAMQTDFGFAKAPGFSETGLFPLHLTGPIDLAFNFADGGERIGNAPQMLWLAYAFKHPIYAWHERKAEVPEPLDLVWFESGGSSPRETGLALDKYFRGAEVVSMRSAWDDRDALFVAFKGGDNRSNHSHLDLGTFVLDALGHRWAIDLGADDYNLPGYFGSQRWSYYRLRAEGHNALVIIDSDEGPDQDPGASANIIRFESGEKGALAIADLTKAYGGRVRSALRGIAMPERQGILVQDEVRAHSPSDVWWFMHTPAKIEISAKRNYATLTQRSTHLSARILWPNNARFEVLDAVPLPTSPKSKGQAENEGIKKLAIHLSNVIDVQMAVYLSPFENRAGASFITLSEWVQGS
jgi:hypothetical protein